MATMRLVPSTYAVSNSSYVTVSNVSNMYTNTDSTTYGTFTHNRASTSNTYYAYIRGFNFDDIPSNAEVTGFTIKLKASATGHTTSTWTFNGWHEGSASGTSHSAGSSFTPSGNITMYARWNTSDSTGSVTMLTAAQCTRTGYTLLGFSTSSTATTATWQPGASYTPTAAIELFAVWKANTYTSIYHNGSWQAAPVYIYQNGAWVDISTVIKVYNGTKWTEI